MDAGWRVIDCSNLIGKIGYERGHIVVQRDGEKPVPIPLVQVAVVLIGVQTTISGAALTKLSEADVALLVCDWRNVPVAGTYPWREHTRIGARQRAQSRLSTPRTKQAWKRIVQAKIRGQSEALQSITGEKSNRLIELSRGVKTGDSENSEALAARIYWQKLRTQGFNGRHPGLGDGVNGALDYGYTLLRGHGIRAVVSAGLSGALGVFHRGRSNSFALVDDLMEPFRPMVDQIVFTELAPLKSLAREEKLTLNEGIAGTFQKDGKSLPTVFSEFAQQYGLYVENEVRDLVVPHWCGVCHAGER